MKPNSFTTVVIIHILICGAFSVLAQATALAQEKSPFEKQREVNTIVAKYRRARTDFAKKEEAVEEALEYGTPAVAAVLAAVEKDLNPQLIRYRGDVMKRAMGHYKKRTTGSNLDEIVKLRQAVLALKDREGLTKENIVSVADPAMKRLEEIFIIDRQEVLKGADALTEQRQRIGQIGRLWEKCAVHVHEATPAEDESPQESPSFENYLQGEEKLAIGMAAPMDARTRAVLSANMQLAGRIDREEARGVLALNLTRNLLGLPPVVIDLRLCAAARDHSKDMETLNFFAHESQVPGKKTPFDRAKRFGTSANSENIFMGSTDGRVANQAWFHSPGHHKNMLGNHRRVGMGRSGKYWTELFGK